MCFGSQKQKEVDWRRFAALGIQFGNYTYDMGSGSWIQSENSRKAPQSDNAQLQALRAANARMKEDLFNLKYKNVLLEKYIVEEDTKLEFIVQEFRHVWETTGGNIQNILPSRIAELGTKHIQIVKEEDVKVEEKKQLYQKLDPKTPATESSHQKNTGAELRETDKVHKPVVFGQVGASVSVAKPTGQKIISNESPEKHQPAPAKPTPTTELVPPKAKEEFAGSKSEIEPTRQTHVGKGAQGSDHFISSDTYVSAPGFTNSGAPQEHLTDEQTMRDFVQTCSKRMGEKEILVTNDLEQLVAAFTMFSSFNIETKVQGIEGSLSSDDDVDRIISILCDVGKAFSIDVDEMYQLTNNIRMFSKHFKLN